MRNVKLWIFIAIVIVLIVLNSHFGWSSTILGDDAQARLQQMLAQNPVKAGAIYLLICVVGAVALALPGVLFAVVSGAIFGPVWGTLLCWASMSIAAGVSYILGRYFLKDSIKPKLQKYPLLNKYLFDGADRSDAYLLAVTRLIPVFPFNIQNFAYGVTDVRFVPYMVYSSLFIFPGTAAYTVATAGVVDGEHRVPYLAVAAALFAVALIAAYFLKKREGIAS